MIIKNAQFKTSVANITVRPHDLSEIAFSGKSNSGKSSLINYLTGQKSLARTSSTPGRTRLLNYFLINAASEKEGAKQFYFVDLPGYGFAAGGSKEAKASFFALADEYFKSSRPPKHIFILMDIRNGASADDLTLINFLAFNKLPFSVVATKADKVSKAQGARLISALSTALKLGRDNIIPVSSFKKTGADKILAVIEQSLTI